MNAVTKLVEQTSNQNKDKLIVVTESSGNHGQALSLAAKLCGVKAHIVMPKTCPLTKVHAVEGYGGQVTLCEPSEKVCVYFVSWSCLFPA